MSEYVTRVINMDKIEIEAKIKNKTVKDVAIFIKGCTSEEELELILQYEERNKKRKGVVKAVKSRKIELGFPSKKRVLSSEESKDVWSPEEKSKDVWSPEEKSKDVWSPEEKSKDKWSSGP